MKNINYKFPVELSDIKTNGIIIPKKKAVIRTDTREPIGIVSDRYALVKHDEVVSSLRKALSKRKYEEKMDISNNGSKMFVKYSLPEIKVPVSKGDLVSLELLARNSYDGSKSFTLSMGAFRLVCSNGMVLGNEFFSYTKKHFEKGINFLEEGFVYNVVEEMIAYFSDTADVFKKMTSNSVKDADTLFNDKNLSLPKYLIDEAKNSYTNENDNTVWGFYNSLTYSITHKMKKDRMQAKFDYSRKAWEYSNKLI